MATKRDYRIEITYPDDARARKYIVRKGERVSFMSAAETPEALSNLVRGEAATLRFSLEDAINGTAAVEAVRAALKRANPVANPDRLPRARVWVR